VVEGKSVFHETFITAYTSARTVTGHQLAKIASLKLIFGREFLPKFVACSGRVTSTVAIYHDVVISATIYA